MANPVLTIVLVLNSIGRDFCFCFLSVLVVTLKGCN